MENLVEFSEKLLAVWRQSNIVPTLQKGNLSLDNKNTPGRPPSDFARVIFRFLRDKPFLSACVLAKGLTTSPHTIKEIVVCHLGMKKITRIWVSHQPTPANKRKRVKDARMLL
jgi:hypothetical protein